ncbi:cobalamin B12-binding domain-containing protein [Paracraurococcus lichenis]|uniref:Cobalamin B12-binding domain-containing protein n=1 Tax=Paracraurococcus lichenis TaxID=3064888 RepID=A0ABT9DU81_9PROT|nr:cobalamin B12-binding domain-containing protein [Paracraurococcus sp. LOR1-02]MDO9707452.1 cobalamin B12-binding domain-containing protein [Paracraurococcus sp. LOR1-02]
MVALGQSAIARHGADDPSVQARLFLPVAGLLPLAAATPPPGPDHAADRQAALLRAIEDAVLPRLLLARGASRAVLPGPDAPREAAPTAGDAEALFGLLTRDDRDGIAQLVVALRGRGVPIGRIFLDLLAPAARALGRAWEEDRCDFGTVTLGLLRLQHTLRDGMAEFLQEVRPPAQPRRILLVLPPGEQHSFGRDMLAGFFRRAGWSVWDPPPRSSRDFAGLVRRQRFEVIGISASTTARLDAIAGWIRTVRRSLLNGDAGIMVGGPLFAGQPEHVALVGADATASDGNHAILQAERLLSLLTRRD